MLKRIVNMPKLMEISRSSDITDKDLLENSEFIYIDNEEIFKAIESLPSERNKKGDGSKADQIARQFNISVSTVYLIIKILKKASPRLLYDVRAGKITIKEAYKMLHKNNSNHSFIDERSDIQKIKDNVFWAHIKITLFSKFCKDEKYHYLLDEAESYLFDAEEGIDRISK